MEEAIKKIKEEMSKNKDFYTQEIGKHALVQIETNKKASDEIGKGAKTLAGSLKHLENEAKKRVVKGQQCVMISDEEGFKIINDYFGFENIQEDFEKVVVDDPVEKVEENNVIEIDFSVEMEDLFK